VDVDHHCKVSKAFDGVKDEEAASEHHTEYDAEMQVLQQRTHKKKAHIKEQFWLEGRFEKLKIQSTAKKQKGTVQASSGTQLDQVAQGAQPSPNHGENGEEGGNLKPCHLLQD
jgi:FKBP-type peptidyl-prolyl cis-trans isomerase